MRRDLGPARFVSVLIAPALHLCCHFPFLCSRNQNAADASTPMGGGSGEAAMSPPSSGSGKRGRDPEEDVYVDNLHSHKRYLSEVRRPPAHAFLLRVLGSDVSGVQSGSGKAVPFRESWWFIGRFDRLLSVHPSISVCWRVRRNGQFYSWILCSFLRSWSCILWLVNPWSVNLCFTLNSASLPGII